MDNEDAKQQSPLWYTYLINAIINTILKYVDYDYYMISMRKATIETMPNIAGAIGKEIDAKDGNAVKELMKDTGVTSSRYIEKLLESIQSYYVARAVTIMKTKGKEAALEYARNQMVPEILHPKGMVMAITKEVPLLQILESRAENRVKEVEEYFKDKKVVMKEGENIDNLALA